jgi:ParB family chromosome partitioning protein
MTITTIPLNKLVPSSSNVRKTGGQSIDDLAASISANGLLQNLTVIEAAKGKYEVIAGGRRLAALQRLATLGALGKDHPVPCAIRDAGEAVELSLTENTIRQAMHPADQFDAFKALVDQGMTETDIAARFGISDKTVKQRLKLAMVSPTILSAFRDDKLSLEKVMAFTLTDDHAKQEQVFENLDDWDDADDIRTALTEEKIDTDDRRVKFLGIDAYLDAGGTLTRDLFSEDDEGYVDNVALLNSLVTERLEAEASKLRAEGFKWVEAHIEMPYLHYGDFSQLRDKKTKALVAATGALVGLDRNGDLKVERLILRKGEKHPLSAGDTNAGASSGTANTAPPVKPEFSASLMADLTAHRTQALQASLMGNPTVALTALVHALTLSRFYHDTWGTCLKISVSQASLSTHMGMMKAQETVAAKALEAKHAYWASRLPEQTEQLWSWLTDVQFETQIELLAYLIAPGIDAIQVNGNPQRHPHSDVLAEALRFNMADWWEADEAFLSRISKDQILEAIEEGTGQPPQTQHFAMKKGELVKAAVKRLAGTRWLPKPLRKSEPVTVEAQLAEAA